LHKKNPARFNGVPDFFMRSVLPQDSGPRRTRHWVFGAFRQKAGRGWHHHSRAPHRRSMGQGG
jgi:hypothetical protein